MKKALIIFAKSPVPGTVKTRLQVDMGAERTVEIYKSFVTEVSSRCVRIKGVDRFLGCAPSKDHPFLKDLADAKGMKMFNQRGKTLGDRIFNAFRHCGRNGYSEIVLIGSDSPSMPTDFIKKAFAGLKKHDCVIGPCFDQGLYLIGVKKEQINRLSRSIALDTGQDVSLILKALAKTDIKLSMLPFWYDIDTVVEYNFLKLHLSHLKRKLPA